MKDILRDVSVDGFRLVLWDTGREIGGKSRLGYRFHDKDASVLFEGEDFGCSPCHAIDSDETLRSLLGFLTLRPGDTDAEYFEEYTAAQLDFAQSDAEALSLWSMEPEAGEELPAFEDWQETT